MENGKSNDDAGEWGSFPSRVDLAAPLTTPAFLGGLRPPNHSGKAPLKPEPLGKPSTPGEQKML